MRQISHVRQSRVHTQRDFLAPVLHLKSPKLEFKLTLFKHLGPQRPIKIKYDCHLLYLILNYLICDVEQQATFLYI